MTVGEMLDRMSAREFYAWQVFDHVEYRDRKKTMPPLPKPAEGAD